MGCSPNEPLCGAVISGLTIRSCSGIWSRRGRLSLRLSWPIGSQRSPSGESHYEADGNPSRVCCEHRSENIVPIHIINTHAYSNATWCDRYLLSPIQMSLANGSSGLWQSQTMVHLAAVVHAGVVCSDTGISLANGSSGLWQSQTMVHLAAVVHAGVVCSDTGIGGNDGGLIAVFSNGCTQYTHPDIS